MKTKIRLIAVWILLAVGVLLWIIQPAQVPAIPLALAAFMASSLLRMRFGRRTDYAPKRMRMLFPATGIMLVAVLFIVALNAYSVNTPTWLMPTMVTLLILMAFPCILWGLYDDYQLFRGNHIAEKAAQPEHGGDA